MSLTAGACSKSSAPASPVAPSNQSSTAFPSAPLSGATIAGTVLSGVSAASLSAMSLNSKTAVATGAAITVTVSGTSISTTVDVKGNFTLQNVPNGDITLTFTSAGMNASVTVTGVNTADRIHITVVVNGNSADIDEHEHDSADDKSEVEGRVTATACSATPPTITVGSTMPKTVNVQNASIHHGGTTLKCADIQVTDRVEAHGTLSGTTLVATDVNVETPKTPNPGGGDGNKDGHDNEASVNGTVAGASAGHACPAFTFTVGSTTVTTSAATKFEDATCAAIVNGVRVEVEGTKTAANAIAATKVSKE